MTGVRGVGGFEGMCEGGIGKASRIVGTEPSRSCLEKPDMAQRLEEEETKKEEATHKTTRSFTTLPTAFFGLVLII